MEYDLEVDGTRVTLKRALPLRDGAQVPRLLVSMRPGDLDAAVEVMARLIESWDFPGDPAERSAWDDLDTFAVVWPLWRLVDAHLGERITSDPKAKVNGSSPRSPGRARSPSAPTSSGS